MSEVESDVLAIASASDTLAKQDYAMLGSYKGKLRVDAHLLLKPPPELVIEALCASMLPLFAVEGDERRGAFLVKRVHLKRAHQLLASSRKRCALESHTTKPVHRFGIHGGVVLSPYGGPVVTFALAKKRPLVQGAELDEGLGVINIPFLPLAEEPIELSDVALDDGSPLETQAVLRLLQKSIVALEGEIGLRKRLAKLV